MGWVHWSLVPRLVRGVPPHVDCHFGWYGLALRVNTEHGGKFGSTSTTPHPPPPSTHTHSVARYMPFDSFVDAVVTVPISKRQPSVHVQRSNPRFIHHSNRVGWRVGRGAWERAWPHLTSFIPSPVEDGLNSVPGSWHMMGHVHTAVWQRSQS